MNTGPYDVLQKGTTEYEFESVGHKGIVKKRVEISRLKQIPGLFNFGFGDVRPDGTVDDKAETNNGDLIRVFSTIIQIMEDFMKTHPLSTLYFAGSNQQRTNVYHLILKRYYTAFSKKFDITALKRINNQSTEVEYDPKEEGEYLAFLVRKKQ